ncbi:branched-chain amino acid transport system II carrier protein [Lawsonibacter celer]|uniref:branched-chain amino acid transport system II carrier protein n=1 Tax=Lawsonibacter celer TaxID=2986526 RepID=UPI00164773DA|nr:branched-chain amino acid transport system II carrier protein [Lawsonibacter celer]
MKKRLTWRETVTITSMLFGMFFGAGNLIFPVHMGQMAGRNVWQAVAGFLITGVGLPLLGVAALGISRSEGVADLSSRVGKRYGTFFTCALYLTIGPFFAIPRCATVSFEVGIAPMLTEWADLRVLLGIFTLVFFALVLFFSLRPGKILTWVGKVLNPVFLLTLGVLVITALVRPMGEINAIVPEATYASGAFFKGFLEGYHTMDALAGLAFGIVVVHVVRALGVTEPGAVAGNTVRAGVFSCTLMAVIYLAVTLAGVESRGIYPLAANGGETLAVIAGHYFGRIGMLILAAAVILACLKTAVGLITSCGEAFAALFPGGPSYRAWAVLFCVVSLLIANLGLNAIIAYSLPVLLFLYPLAITLILLALFGRLWGNDPLVYRLVTVFTLAAAIFDLFQALPAGTRAFLRLDRLVAAAERILPFFSLGLGWICPALLGLGAGLLCRALRKRLGKG